MGKKKNNSNEHRWTVLVHFGTQVWPSVYAPDLTEAEAGRMRETAKQFGYRDAWVERDWQPEQRGKVA